MRPAFMSMPYAAAARQNFTCGGVCAFSLAVNSAIGLLERKKVAAHSTPGKVAKLGVVDAHRFDVVAPRDRDAVFGAFELRLQRQEVLVGLEVGIVLADREQPAERAGKLVLRVLELLQLVGIGELRGVDLHLRRLGARLDHRGQDAFLLLGIALHGGDQIGDEIGAALIVVLHVRPFRLGLLLVGRDGVVAAAGEREPEKNGGNNTANARHR